ncbi:MAG: phosphatase PAP2 family protein [Ktedonobacteraceae bacterium]
MSNHTIVDANEHIIVEAPVIRPLRVRCARYVSNILAPSTISLPFVLLVSLYHSRSTTSALLFACLTLFFLTLGPMVYILIGVRKGWLSDVDVSRRTERAGPFLFGITSVALGFVLLRYVNAPKNLETLLLITTISGVIMLIVTLWWKISIHASSLAGAATMLTVLYGAAMLPTFLLLILVSWSRVVLRRHTTAQVIAGSLLSIALSVSILLLRGV